MENPKNIDKFVEAVNNNAKLKDDLDKAVQKALPKTHFKDLEAFENFLPDAIKNFFDGEENLGKLGEKWKSFKIQNGDLDKLYEINLEP